MPRSSPARTFISLILPAVDLALLAAGFVLAMWLRLGWPPPAFNWEGMRNALPWTMLIALAIYYALGLYVNSVRSLASIYRQLLLANTAVLLTLVVLAFWLRAFSVPRSVIIIAFLLHCLLLGAWRTLYMMLRLAIQGKQRLLVVGTAEDCKAIRTKLNTVPPGWFVLIDTLTPEDFWVNPDRFKLEIDAVAIGGSVNHETRRHLLIWLQEAQITSYIVPDLYDIMVDGHSEDQFYDLPVFRIQPLGLSQTSRLAKRAFDLIVTLPFALVSLPIALLAMFAVRLTSKGPALYSQERVGRDGKAFTLWKIRSMVSDAERAGPRFASANDPRVTPVGKWLRKTRIDELPQLWNVLHGDMSLVGPRPERPVFVARFAQENPEYPLRHLVKPGVTGLAQVMGNYSTSAVDKLRFDLHYIRNQSLWGDIKILLLSVKTVLNPDQAEGVHDKP